MNCPNCHKEIPDDAKFCPLCGTQVQSNEPETEPQTQSPAPNDTPVAAKKRPNKKILAGFIFLLCYILFSPFRSIVGVISMLAVPVLGVLLILALLFKKPKKKLAIGFLAAIILSIIFICSFPTCDHEWTDATCTQPQTCSKCGKTEGEALGHDWLDATCDAPKTCSRCGETEGEALGHDWDGLTCTKCGKTKCEVNGHTPGDWVAGTPDIISASTEDYQLCQVCGEKVNTRDEPMTTLYQNGTFLFSPNQFTQRLNNMFQYIRDCSMRAELVTVDAKTMGTVIMDGSTHIATLLYTNNNSYMGTGSKDSENQMTAIMCGFETSEVEQQIPLMLGIIKACDPSISNSDTSDVVKQTVLSMYNSNTYYEKNGINYLYGMIGNAANFVVSVYQK